MLATTKLENSSMKKITIQIGRLNELKIKMKVKILLAIPKQRGANCM